jgi:hypothetical protein
MKITIYHMSVICIIAIVCISMILWLRNRVESGDNYPIQPAKVVGDSHNWSSFSSLLHKSKQTEGFALSIPKKIWSYWDSTEMPEIITQCIASWKKYNPNYEITMVHRNTVQNYVNIPKEIANHPNFNDTRSRFADLVRLYLLEAHGGIWIDASCLMYQGFDEWLPQTEFFCYIYNQGKQGLRYPVLENWFIAAQPGNDFVQAWKREFLEIANYGSVQEYVDSRKRMGVDISSFENMANYLAMHVGAQKLLQIDKYPLSKLTLRETGVEGGGPMWFLVKHGWVAEKAVEDVCKNPGMRKPFLKFHGPSRDVFSKLLHTTMTNDTCKWF